MFKQFQIVFILILFSLPNLSLALDVPVLSGQTNDLTQTLDITETDHLNKILREYEIKSGNQIAILIIANLENENLEDYSHKVAETWGLGQKGKDNGILLLVAKNDRKLRIEVGYGLESKLTDAIASAIINQTIVPQFKQNHFYQGIEEGTLQIIEALEGKPILVSNPTPTKQSQPMPILTRMLMFLFFGPVFLWLTYNMLFSRALGQVVIYYLVFMLFWLIIPGLIFGEVLGAIVFLMYVFGFPITRVYLETKRKDIFDKHSPIGSSSNSVFGGSSSSGSGFTGGGGSFGGGGSSGSW